MGWRLLLDVARTSVAVESLAQAAAVAGPVVAAAARTPTSPAMRARRMRSSTRSGRAPTIWFQQMDAPRLQRNRIHLDISVPHDEAQRRIQAAGGTLVSDAEAPVFWILADAEGNEACITTCQAGTGRRSPPITTWRGRDG
jgi:Glyoxalase-like domain